MSKHFPPEIERKHLTFCFISRSSPTAVPPFFGVVSCCRNCSAEIPGIRYAVDEAEADGCPQEESLRTVLRNLGIPESELQGSLRKFPGVRWSLWQCNQNQQKKWSNIFGMKKCSKSRQIPCPKNLWAVLWRVLDLHSRSSVPDLWLRRSR